MGFNWLLRALLESTIKGRGFNFGGGFHMVLLEISMEISVSMEISRKNSETRETLGKRWEFLTKL
jgi:hypothetical protein